MAKHPLRAYEITFEIYKKSGNVTKKMTVMGKDSIHASAYLYKMFGRTRINIKSAIKKKVQDEG